MSMPAWFEAAIGQVGTRSALSVHGAAIEYRCWGSGRGLPLLFIHGNGANANWWDFIAPLFARDNPVAAISLSGNGMSQWRAAYDLDIFVDETLAAARHLAASTGRAPIIVGHSLGGHVSAEMARRYPEDLAGLVVIDAGPIDDARITALKRPDRGARPVHVSPTRKAILERFRLSPAQTCRSPFALRYIAEQSIRPVDGGWSLRADPNLPQAIGSADATMRFADVACPLAQIYGAQSRIMQRDDVSRFLSIVRPGTPAVEIADAGHHVFVDQPIAVVAALRALISGFFPFARTLTEVQGVRPDI